MHHVTFLGYRKTSKLTFSDGYFDGQNHHLMGFENAGFDPYPSQISTRSLLAYRQHFSYLLSHPLLHSRTLVTTIILHRDVCSLCVTRL